MQMSMFNVSTVELCTRYASNSNSRRIRITGKHWAGNELVTDTIEITLYGNTDSLEALPHSADFIDHDPVYIPPSPQVDIEDYLRSAKPRVTAATITDEQLEEISREARASVIPDRTDAEAFEAIVGHPIPTVDHIAADLAAAVALDEASEEPDPAYIDAQPGPSVEEEQPSLAKSEIF